MCVDGEAGPYRGRGAFYDYDYDDDEDGSTFANCSKQKLEPRFFSMI